jgi:hypothetical protein
MEHKQSGYHEMRHKQSGYHEMRQRIRNILLEVSNNEIYKSIIDNAIKMYNGSEVFDSSWIEEAITALESNRMTHGYIWDIYEENGSLTIQDIKNAIRAYERHNYTNYDDLLDSGFDRDTARILMNQEDCITMLPLSPEEKEENKKLKDEREQKEFEDFIKMVQDKYGFEVEKINGKKVIVRDNGIAYKKRTRQIGGNFDPDLNAWVFGFKGLRNLALASKKHIIGDNSK